MTIQPFLPPLLPLCATEDNWGTYGNSSSLAAAMLGRFSGMMDASAKADLFWLMWMLRESQYSNEIEGTVTTLDEVLENSVGLQIPVERREDVQEVFNYRSTMLLGADMLATGTPLSLFLVRTLHGRLLQGTRGADKSPGAWRNVQVHIGKRGTPLTAASYIPPAPEHVPGLLENWIAFIQRTDIDPIVQAAVMHAQFEMIHPFVDGNGRMGRLLISLFLTEKGLLSKPCFYMSAYLQEHREEYYTALGEISRAGCWKRWIRFFITAILERSRANITTLREMTALYEECKKKLHDCTSSGYAINILDYAFENPIFTVPTMAKTLQVSVPALFHLIQKLQQAGFFQCVRKGSGRQAALWSFGHMMDILQR